MLRKEEEPLAKRPHAPVNRWRFPSLQPCFVLQGPLGAWFPRAWLFALVADTAALLLHLLVIAVYASVAS